MCGPVATRPVDDDDLIPDDDDDNDLIPDDDDDEAQVGHPNGPRPALGQRVLSVPPWRVAIIDDDQDVHAATAFALAGFEHAGRPLQFLHAHSGREGAELFGQHRDIAVAFIDVVMEDERAGLSLVEQIRTKFDNRRTRIVLRTGQPGYAPQAEVVRLYDINDYREKGELDARRLTTTLISALRAFHQIELLERHRDGLTILIDALGQMFGRRALDKLAEGVIHQLAAVLKVSPEGLVCAQQKDTRSALILAATGRLADARGRPLADLPHSAVAAFIGQCLDERRTLLSESGICLYVETPSDKRVCVYAAAEPDRLPSTDQQLLAILGRNISLAFDNAELFEHIQYRAYYEPETGLPNLASYEVVIQERFDDDRPFIVVVLEIIRFRMIRDGIGATLAATVVQTFAHLLKQTFPDACFIGRIGSDDFVLVLDGTDERAYQAFAALRTALAAPLDCDGLRTPVRVSGGFAAAPRDGTDPVTLLRHASVALAELPVGRHAGRLRPYQPSMLDSAIERLNLTVALQEALQSGGIALFFQPIFPAHGDRPIAAEALLRVSSADGFFPTPRLIDAAEHSGLIAELGIWVLKHALMWQAEMLRTGHPLSVAVNLSPTQLDYDDIRRIIEETLAATDADPTNLILEMTEQMFLDPEVGSAVEVFSWFRSIGGRVAIDDFGTGYSSLRYLHRLPVDIVKIDRAFIAPLDPDAGAEGLSAVDRDRPRRILENLVALAKSLDLKITAEGVETERQLTAMQALGVDTIQGFYLSRPIPAGDFRPWLETLPRAR